MWDWMRLTLARCILWMVEVLFPHSIDDEVRYLLAVREMLRDMRSKPSTSELSRSRIDFHLTTLTGLIAWRRAQKVAHRKDQTPGGSVVYPGRRSSR